jgi:hypothetical protein
VKAGDSTQVVFVYEVSQHPSVKNRVIQIPLTCQKLAFLLLPKLRNQVLARKQFRHQMWNGEQVGNSPRRKNRDRLKLLVLHFSEGPTSQSRLRPNTREPHPGRRFVINSLISYKNVI